MSEAAPHSPTQPEAFDALAEAEKYAQYNAEEQRFKEMIGAPGSSDPVDPNVLPQTARDTADMLRSRPTAEDGGFDHVKEFPVGVPADNKTVHMSENAYQVYRTVHDMPDQTHYRESMPQSTIPGSTKELVEAWAQAEVDGDRTRANDVQDALQEKLIASGASAEMIDTLYERKEKMKAGLTPTQTETVEHSGVVVDARTGEETADNSAAQRSERSAEFAYIDGKEEDDDTEDVPEGPETPEEPEDAPEEPGTPDEEAPAPSDPAEDTGYRPWSSRYTWDEPGGYGTDEEERRPAADGPRVPTWGDAADRREPEFHDVDVPDFMRPPSEEPAAAPHRRPSPYPRRTDEAPAPAAPEAGDAGGVPDFMRPVGDAGEPRPRAASDDGSEYFSDPAPAPRVGRLRRAMHRVAPGWVDIEEPASPVAAVPPARSFEAGANPAEADADDRTPSGFADAYRGITDPAGRTVVQNKRRKLWQGIRDRFSGEVADDGADHAAEMDRRDAAEYGVDPAELDEAEEALRETGRPAVRATLERDEFDRPIVPVVPERTRPVRPEDARRVVIDEDFE